MTQKHLSQWKIVGWVVLSLTAPLANAAEKTAAEGAAEEKVEAPTAVTPASAPVTGSAAKSDSAEPVKVNLTEADGYGAVFGGLSYNTSFNMGFAAEGGYRFFKNFPQVGLGANFAYNKISATNQFMVFEAHAEYALSDENRGPVFRLGMGYGATARIQGFAISPSVAYYFPILGAFTVGAQLTVDGVIGSRALSTLSGYLGLRYWF